jgi:hypothetical protein
VTVRGTTSFDTTAGALFRVNYGYSAFDASVLSFFGIAACGVKNARGSRVSFAPPPGPYWRIRHH